MPPLDRVALRRLCSMDIPMFAAVNASGPPFAELEGDLLVGGLAPSDAVAVDRG